MFEDREDYIKLVNKIAKSVKFKPIFNLNPWFVIKIQLSYQLHLCYATKKWPDLSKTANSYLNLKNFKKKLFLLKELILLFPKLCYYRFFCSFPPIEILLVGYKTNNVKLKREENNYYLLPFINKFQNKNSFIYYIDGNENPNKVNTYLKVLLKWYKTFYLWRISESKKKQLLTYGDAINQILNSENYKAISGLDFFITNQILEYLVYKSSYKLWLARLKPKQVISYCYYDNRINALFGSANALKIETKEYQHSALTDRHFAYNKWCDVDYVSNHFPKIFMVWNMEDKNLIERNFRGDKYKPVVEVTGILHLKEKFKDRIDLKSDNNILICLQGLWIPKWMETYIVNDKVYNWYFRLHPRYPNDFDKLNQLIKLKRPNIFVDDAKNNTLINILQQTKIVITGFSGAAIEAHNFGVKVLIFGVEGKESYKKLIEEQIFHFVENSKVFDRKLKEEKK